MASYIAVHHDPAAIAGAREGVAALVVADDAGFVVVCGDETLCGDLLTRHDQVRAAVGGVAGGLAAVAESLTFYAVEGPLTFDGAAVDVAPVLAKMYGLTA